MGALNKFGYGKIKHKGRTLGAHRVAFWMAHGRWPDGPLDHICHDPKACQQGVKCPHRACLNTDHLVESTPRANALRGYSEAARNARKTVCDAGHPLDAQNTYVWTSRRTGRTQRRCRRCNADAARQQRRKARSL